MTDLLERQFFAQKLGRINHKLNTLQMPLNILLQVKTCSRKHWMFLVLHERTGLF